MLPSIPASNIVTINPSVIGTGGDALDLNTVVLSDSSVYPVNQYAVHLMLVMPLEHPATSISLPSAILTDMSVQLCNQAHYSLPVITPQMQLQN